MTKEHEAESAKSSNWSFRNSNEETQILVSHYIPRLLCPSTSSHLFVPRFFSSRMGDTVEHFQLLLPDFGIDFPFFHSLVSLFFFLLNATRKLISIILLSPAKFFYYFVLVFFSGVESERCERVLGPKSAIQKFHFLLLLLEDCRN